MPLTPDVTANGSVGLTLGGQITAGPGAGTALVVAVRGRGRAVRGRPAALASKMRGHGRPPHESNRHAACRPLCVGVTAHRLRFPGLEYRVQGQEPAGLRLVLACAEQVQAGHRVGGLVDESAVVWPGHDVPAGLPNGS